METALFRIVELQGADNVRDLGGIPACKDRVVNPGLFYRGPALTALTASDKDLLFRQLKITCMIDLRCGWERDISPIAPQSGVEHMHIPFYDLEIVGLEYHEPAKGTKVIGRDVACDPDHFYRSLVNPRTVDQMRKGLAKVFEHTILGAPVYVHCSSGKDRAGIMALLIFAILGASREDILADYLLTNISRDKNYQSAFKRFLRFTDGDEVQAHELTLAHRAREENLSAFYEAVDDSYGSMDSFIRNQLAISDEHAQQIRLACTHARSMVPGLKIKALGR